MSALYGNTSAGYNRIASARRIVGDVFYAQYHADAKKVRCDAQGNFAFRNVPNGDYFVTTLVHWIVPVNTYVTNQEGGGIMRAVSVRGADATDVILSN
jgi:hypothetical protein